MRHRATRGSFGWLHVPLPVPRPPSHLRSASFVPYFPPFPGFVVFIPLRETQNPPGNFPAPRLDEGAGGDTHTTPPIISGGAAGAAVCWERLKEAKPFNWAFNFIYFTLISIGGKFGGGGGWGMAPSKGADSAHSASLNPGKSGVYFQCDAGFG